MLPAETDALAGGECAVIGRQAQGHHELVGRAEQLQRRADLLDAAAVE